MYVIAYANARGFLIIFNRIKEQPGIQIKELLEKLSRPRDTLNKQIKKLTQMNLIERRGSKKTRGYWIIESKDKRDEG